MFSMSMNCNLSPDLSRVKRRPVDSRNNMYKYNWIVYIYAYKLCILIICEWWWYCWTTTLLSLFLFPVPLILLLLPLITLKFFLDNSMSYRFNVATQTNIYTRCYGVYNRLTFKPYELFWITVSHCNFGVIHKVCLMSLQFKPIFSAVNSVLLLCCCEV